MGADYRFRWDRERKLLVYDGTTDPDPRWRWVPEKQGYEPVNPDNLAVIWDPRIGAWVFLQEEVH